MIKGCIKNLIEEWCLFFSITKITANPLEIGTEMDYLKLEYIFPLI
jgi:hypothetical protein